MRILSLKEGSVPSLSFKTSSYNFSPARKPVYSISTFVAPERRIIRLAKSAMRTGLPISNTKISPPLPFVPASKTSLQASGISMKKRIILGSVTVTGPPARICFSKRGMTEPLEPKTLPKRVVTNWVVPLTLFSFSALSRLCT